METYSDLYRALTKYCASDAYPFHMPGHKRRMGAMADPYSFDITEIDGFDNLHHAQGILKRAMERAAALYGAQETYYLVNGSTAGILSAISAAAARDRAKRRIVMARNCHRAAWHAVYLNDLEPVFVYPAARGQINGPVEGRSIEAALRDNKDVCAVFLTSPTYDGVVSDIRQIADICHHYDCLLIVDEAHGAHFGFHPDLPESAVRCGADLVIQSVHKTLPALTQTALLHRCSGRCDGRLLQRFLDIYQTSSPSYVLMASIDQSLGIMKRRGEALLEDLLGALKRFDESISGTRILYRIQTDDPTKILISGANTLSGPAMCAILRQKYHLEMEMCAPSYVLALTSVGDDEEGLVRLSQAVRQIDEELFLQLQFPERRSGWIGPFMQRFPLLSGGGCAGSEGVQIQTQAYAPDRALSLKEAWDHESVAVPLQESAGDVCAEFVYLYPPGIPLLLPGEKISDRICGLLCTLRDRGYELQGMADYSMEQIHVIKALPEQETV